jgi:hypothetical protein
LMQTTKFPEYPIIENHLLKELYSILKINWTKYTIKEVKLKNKLFLFFE